MRSTPQTLGLLAAALAVTALAGCAAEPPTPDGATPDGAAPSPAASSAPPSPSVSQASGEPSDPSFAYPDTSDPTQVAIYLKYTGDDPSGEIIAGPAVLVADRQFTIEAQCEGGGASFEVKTADGEARTLAEGDFTCADPPAGEFTYRIPYAGPVQINLLDADDVTRAWVRVVQP